MIGAAMQPNMRKAMVLVTDRKLRKLRPLRELSRPSKGWIRTIRETLGITTQQMAMRMGVTQPRVVRMEKDEPRGGISLETLKKAADALDCELIYALVPRSGSLEAYRQDQARHVARKMLAQVDHTMALENQSATDRTQNSRLAEMTAEVLRSDRLLWSEYGR